MPKKKTKQKKIVNSKVASHILCPLFVFKLPHECEDITKNAWRTPLNSQCNIEYRLKYARNGMIFLQYHTISYILYNILIQYIKNIAIDILLLVISNRISITI